MKRRRVLDKEYIARLLAAYEAMTPEQLEAERKLTKVFDSTAGDGLVELLRQCEGKQNPHKEQITGRVGREKF